MNTRSTLRAAALATLLGATAAGSVFAADVTRSQLAGIEPGQTRAQVEALLGAPDRHEAYLFTKGSADSYRLAGSLPDEERAVRVAFDAQGHVTSTTVMSAYDARVNHFDQD